MTGALRAHALERMVDARRVVHVQERAGAAAAQAALAGVIRIPLDLDHIPVLDIGKNTAVRMAEVAKRLHHLDSLCVDIDLRHIPSSLLLVERA